MLSEQVLTPEAAVQEVSSSGQCVACLRVCARKQLLSVCMCTRNLVPLLAVQTPNQPTQGGAGKLEQSLARKLQPL